MEFCFISAPCLRVKQRLTECTLFSDELECVNASFTSREFEFICSDSENTFLKFTIKPDGASGYVEILFKVPVEYPHVIPSISLSSTSLHNAQRMKLEEATKDYAKTLLEQPMLMDIVLWVKGNFSTYLSKNDDPPPNNDELPNMLVITIDHMRSKSKYVKTIQAWCSELNLTGMLLFCKKWIFLILIGLKKDTKAFGVRLKTTCIDVDSSGKACKEKMSKIIYEAPCTLSLDDFCIQEFASVFQLESYFAYKGLTDVYDNCIFPLITI